jgi:hypothetical protein
MIVSLLCLVPAAAVADAARVTLYTGSGADNCNLYDTGTALHEVYVVYVGPTGITAVEFQLQPTYGASLTYLGHMVVQEYSMSVGNPDTGIGVALGDCFGGSVVQVLKVLYQGLGVSQTCSRLLIRNDPHSVHQNPGKIFSVDCSYTGVWVDAGYLVINPDDDCECASPGSGGPSPVAATTWGGIKAMYKD